MDRQMVGAAFPKLDTMRWSVDLQRIHVTLAIYVTRTQFEGIQDRSLANTFSELCSFPVQRRDYYGKCSDR